MSSKDSTTYIDLKPYGRAAVGIKNREEGRGTYRVEGSKVIVEIQQSDRMGNVGRSFELVRDGKVLVNPDHPDERFTKQVDYSPSPLDQEALKVVQDEYWNRRFAICGDSYLFNRAGFGQALYPNYVDAIQFKDVVVKIEPDDLSDADRMNGMEWKGNVYATTKLSRWHGRGRWYEWQSRDIYEPAYLQKKRGQWTDYFGHPLREVFTGNKPDCAILSDP